MEIDFDEHDGICVADLSGRLDAVNSSKAENLIRKKVEEGVNKIVFNLENLEYISSAGLRVLLIASKLLRKSNCSTVVCCLNDNVSKVFDISGFSSVIKVENTLDEALELFK